MDIPILLAFFASFLTPLYIINHRKEAAYHGKLEGAKASSKTTSPSSSKK